VAIGVNSDDAVLLNYELMMSRVQTRMPRARIHGVSGQQMVKGREVIVGMVRDAQFGPVITFGLGGIFVEIMKDVTQRIAPLSWQHVDEMIRSIKAYPILTGARGRKPADIAALKKTILQVSQIAIDFPEISELEVNPVMVGDEGQGCYAVDALVTIRREIK
jgi:acetyltransferase